MRHIIDWWNDKWNWDKPKTITKDEWEWNKPYKKGPSENPWDKIQRQPCRHPGHQFPMHLYIPLGGSYTHTCPGCGQTTTVTNYNGPTL